MASKINYQSKGDFNPSTDLDLPDFEFDVEKLSDRFRIIPYSENPDFYIDFQNILFASQEIYS